MFVCRNTVCTRQTKNRVHVRAFYSFLCVCKNLDRLQDGFFKYVITDIFGVMKYLRECTEAFCTKYGSLWSTVFSYVQLSFTQHYQSVPFSAWIKFSAFLSTSISVLLKKSKWHLFARCISYVNVASDEEEVEVNRGTYGALNC